MGDILKKIFETIGLLSLICFSFFCTNQISMVIRDNDDVLARANDVRKIMSEARLELWKETKTHTPVLEGRKYKELEENIYLHNTELKKSGMGFNYDSIYELDMLLPLGNGMGIENEYIRNEAGLFVPLTKENAPAKVLKPIKK